MLESQINGYVEGFKKKRPPKPSACEVCKCRDRLRWHGSYVRDLIAPAKTYSVPIRRLFCTLCRHTFAFLPFFICKFHRYAKEIITTALHWLKTLTYEATVDLLVNRIMSGREHNLATVTLHLWRHKFTKTNHS